MSGGWGLLDLLPGLYVLLLGALLAAALRRWYDPVPRHVLACFAVLLLVLFGPCLFGGRILLPLSNLIVAAPFHLEGPAPAGNWMQGDLVHQITPWLAEVRRAVRSGSWPLWNPSGGAGMPLLGDPQSQALQPLVMAAWPFPVVRAAVVTASLRVLLALVFTFLFLRRQELGEKAALCGSLAYGLGGFLLIWLGWPIGNCAALLPVVLYAVARCDEPGERRDFLLLFLAAAALLVGGHPETMLYGLVAAGLLVVARAWERRRQVLTPGPSPISHPPHPREGGEIPEDASQLSPLSRRGLGREMGEGPGVRIFFVRTGAALLLAGLAVAPALLLAREYLPQSQRARVVDLYLGSRSLGEVWDDARRPESLEPWRQRSVDRLLPVAAPRAFGDYTHYWGGVNYIEDAGGFAGTAAALAAMAALAALLPWGVRLRFRQERLAAGLLLAGLALQAQPPGFANLFSRLPVIGLTATHHHHRALVLVCLGLAWLAACEVERWQRGATSRRRVLLAAGLLAAVVVGSYLTHPSPRGETRWADFSVQAAALVLAAGLLLLRPAPRWAPWAMAAVVAGELLWMHLPSNPPMPARLAFPTPPPVGFLQDNAGSSQTSRMFGLGNAFLANIPAIYGLRDVRIDNPSLPAAFADLVEPVSRNPLTPRFNRPGHPLYDLLGARWLLARPGTRLQFRLAFQHPAGWVYERPRALPLLFLPARARMHRGGPWKTWVHRNTDFAARTLVLPSAEHYRPWRSRRPAASSVTVTSLEPARVRARAALVEPRLLASSLYQDGNWQLLVDGERTPTVLSNGPLLAGWLPEGSHDIELLYRPRAFVAGCVLAALALAAAALWWVPRPRFPLSCSR